MLSPSAGRPVVTFDRRGGVPTTPRVENLDGSYIELPVWNRASFGGPLVLPVATGVPGDEWAEVHVPSRPPKTVWVQTDDLEWSSSDFYVRVDVATNSMWVWNGDELLIDGEAVSTGRPKSLTPLVTAYVDEIIDSESRGFGPGLGPRIISLTVFSEMLDTFGGGLPKVALHGTDEPGLLGQAVSNGCVRVRNDLIEQLADLIPLGTRVDLVNSAGAQVGG